MIKVAVIDDYQNAFQQIIDIERYKEKFDFKVFNEPFVDEKEAAVELEVPNKVDYESGPNWGTIK